MRIDKLVWYLRFAASRNLAQQWIETGHFRLNGHRIDKPGSGVKVGDIVTLPLRSRVLVIELLCLPIRRGPAIEALTHYRVLDGARENPIAPPQTPLP
ncbi:MAG: RNA-binding S4 domain-containing protein [Novosphingobium sp.]